MVSTALLQSKEVLQNETSSLTQASEDCSSDDLKSPRIALSLQNPPPAKKIVNFKGLHDG